MSLFFRAKDFSVQRVFLHFCGPACLGEDFYCPAHHVCLDLDSDINRSNWVNYSNLLWLCLLIHKMGKITCSS